MLQVSDFVFSEPVYNNVSELIVTGPGSLPVATLDDLSGKEIYVRQSSSYFESLQRLNESFRKFIVVLKQG